MTALVTDSGRRTPARLAGSAILACQSDERLVAMVRDGHERAFEAIVDRYRRPLLRRCRRILPESRAEDAVQQTFLNAHTSLVESTEAVNLKPWLYAIARNVSLNMLRQNGWNYEQIPAEFDGVRRPDQVFEQRAELEQTVSAMNELPERQRSALVMREFEGRSYAEIAAVLGANDGAVRQLLNRARAALRTAATAIMPPPLVARLAASAPPDGRRVAEVAGGLGAAGMAKAGATALVAGSLVVGAVKAPLIDHDKPTRGNAPAAHVAKKTSKPAAAVSSTHPTRPVSEITPTHHTSRSTAPAPSNSGPGPSHNGERTEAEHRSGSTEDRSGSDRSGSDDTRHSGSDDGAGTRSGSGTSSESSDDLTSNSGPGGGSDDALSGDGGSDDVTTLGGTDSSGSGSSGSGESSGSGSGTSGSGSSGSGSDDPLPETRTDD